MAVVLLVCAALGLTVGLWTLRPVDPQISAAPGHLASSPTAPITEQTGDGPAGDGPPGDGPAGPRAAPTQLAAALDVLRAWDRRRAEAWARGDLDGLSRLYTRGSQAGAADRDLLGAYLDRGLVVTGMRTQVLAARLRSMSRDRIALRVTDRLAAATAQGEAGAVPLPRDQASRHTVELVRRDGRWLVTEAS